jgi:hypothetical protein
MPHVITSRRSRNGQSNVIELVLHTGHLSDSVEKDECCVCHESLCLDGEDCSRTNAELGCCGFSSGNGVCCGCLVKIATRCKCDDECCNIISFCPLCRSMSAVESFHYYNASKGACRSCESVRDATDAEEEVVQ